MRVQHIGLGLTAALLALALTGCGGAIRPQDPSSYPAPASTPSGDTAYPAPGSANTIYPNPVIDNLSAYPNPQVAPTVAGRDPEPIPQPAAGMGVVHGTIYNLTTDQPIYAEVTVYLSQIISTDTTAMDAVSVDTTSDPSVTPDREGGFAFANVPPGRYGIVVQGPLNQYLARQADQSQDVVLTVEAGQTVDLGKIYAGYP